MFQNFQQAGSSSANQDQGPRQGPRQCQWHPTDLKPDGRKPSGPFKMFAVDGLRMALGSEPFLGLALYFLDQASKDKLFGVEPHYSTHISGERRLSGLVLASSEPNQSVPYGSWLSEPFAVLVPCNMDDGPPRDLLKFFCKPQYSFIISRFDSFFTQLLGHCYRHLLDMGTCKDRFFPLFSITHVDLPRWKEVAMGPWWTELKPLQLKDWEASGFDEHDALWAAINAIISKVACDSIHANADLPGMSPRVMQEARTALTLCMEHATHVASRERELANEREQEKGLPRWQRTPTEPLQLHMPRNWLGLDQPQQQIQQLHQPQQKQSQHQPRQQQLQLQIEQQPQQQLRLAQPNQPRQLPQQQQPAQQDQPKQQQQLHSQQQAQLQQPSQQQHQQQPQLQHVQLQHPPPQPPPPPPPQQQQQQSLQVPRRPLPPHVSSDRPVQEQVSAQPRPALPVSIAHDVLQSQHLQSCPTDAADLPVTAASESAWKFGGEAGSQGATAASLPRSPHRPYAAALAGPAATAAPAPAESGWGPAPVLNPTCQKPESSPHRAHPVKGGSKSMSVSNVSGGRHPQPSYDVSAGGGMREKAQVDSKPASKHPTSTDRPDEHARPPHRSHNQGTSPRASGGPARSKGGRDGKSKGGYRDRNRDRDSGSDGRQSRSSSRERDGHRGKDSGRKSYGSGYSGKSWGGRDGDGGGRSEREQSRDEGKDREHGRDKNRQRSRSRDGDTHRGGDRGDAELQDESSFGQGASAQELRGQPQFEARRRAASPVPHWKKTFTAPSTGEHKGYVVGFDAKLDEKVIRSEFKLALAFKRHEVIGVVVRPTGGRSGGPAYALVDFESAEGLAHAVGLQGCSAACHLGKFLKITVAGDKYIKH